MLNWARLNKTLRMKLWAHCAYTATKLENMIIKDNTKQTAYEKFYGKNPEWTNFLRTFGEMAIVHDGTLDKIKGKLTNRGMPCIFIGYPEDHAPNVYQFLKLDTESMILSRNVIWLNKSYGEYNNLEVKITHITQQEDSSDEKEYEIIEQDEEYEVITTQESETAVEEQEEEGNDYVEVNDSSDSDDEPQPRTMIKGVNRVLRNLETYYNPDPYRFLEEEGQQGETAMITNLFNPEHLLLANIHDGSPEPKTYYEAKQSKDWFKWWEAMKTEFKNMEEKEVWDICERKKLPTGRQVIGNRWVYALKDDGRYRARTVAKGFSQIPGKDFQGNFAPVINDTTFHLVLVLKTLLKLEAGQFDIETAFLYGELEEELWMQLPDGYSEYVKEKTGKIINTTTHCLKLKKAIYGLVQAARQWWKKFKEVMQSLGFNPSKADPCLFIKNGDGKNKLPAFIIIYVDDGGIFGTKEQVKEVLQALSKGFKVKDLGPLKHFVGCHIVQDTGIPGKIYIHQPKLIKHLEEQFGDKIKDINRTYSTPAGPKTMILRPEKGDKLISAQEQTTYRSGVGMLLYLVKHSRPDISNAVRELSKVADGATLAHWKALTRTIKYVIDTKNYALKIQPTQKYQNFHLEGISDSEYAGDKDTRISVYGYVVYFCGSPIAWKSKSGRSVTLSSTEAEYFAVSEITKEIMFIKQVIESMNIKLNYPIIIKCDNVGAIYLANNHTTGQRTKHIDIRTHFVRQYIEDGIIKIVFVKSEENDADIYTKNTTEELFKIHFTKNVEEMEFYI